MPRSWLPMSSVAPPVHLRHVLGGEGRSRSLIKFLLVRPFFHKIHNAYFNLLVYAVRVFFKLDNAFLEKSSKKLKARVKHKT